MLDPILDNLNQQQYDAVTAPEGPLLIVAGAGTGKTRVITRRLAYLVRERGVQPWQIYAATFTNKAADEMKRRVAELTSNLCSPDYHISTFHSMCARILRREATAAGLDSNFTICDESDQRSAVKLVMKRLGISDKLIKPADAQYVINQCKMRMLGPEDVSAIAKGYEEEYESIFRAYQSCMRESSAVDFEDLILLVVRLFQDVPLALQSYQQRYRHVMVDEYQDTNSVQVELVSLLAGGHRNLAVVGDEDQSIYSWRGADINNLLDFQDHFPDARVVRLEQNYRSTGNILAAASSVIKNNHERLGKTLFTEGGSGAPIFAMQVRSELDEALGVVCSIEELARQGYSYDEIAIFYRVGALGRVFEDRLREFKVPYRIVGGIRFYDRAEIKDLLSYLQVAANPGNSIALLRIINTPRRGFGDKTVQRFVDLAGAEGISVYLAMKRSLASGDVPKSAASKLDVFLTQIENWNRMAVSESPSKIYQSILEDTGYRESLGDPNSLEVIGRLENIDELLSAIKIFEKENRNGMLTDYLEKVSLVSVTDDLSEDQAAVSLMTLHAAKGLEYKVVFLVGLEDGIFPSMRSVTERGDFEEERRLFYVGITRARKILIVSFAAQRMWYGELRYQQPSGFLRELPKNLIEELDPFNPVFSGDRQQNERDEPEVSLDADQTDPSQFEERSSYSAPSRPMTTRDAAPARARGFTLGKRVRHPLLGEGVIAGLSGAGANLQIILHLDDGGVHHLLARYANLELLVNE